MKFTRLLLKFFVSVAAAFLTWKVVSRFVVELDWKSYLIVEIIFVSSTLLRSFVISKL